MIKLGIRAHDIGRFQAKELADKIRAYGFEGAQLVFKKALTSFDIDEVNMAFNPPKIMMLGAYFNPVHPNRSIVDEGIINFRKHLLYANMLQADYVGSETGSLMGNPWGYVPKNHTDEPLAEVITIFKALCDEAEVLHVNIAIEGAYAHVVYSPNRLRQVLDEIASPNLKVTIDLYNFLSIENYQDRMKIFQECLELFPSDIAIFHLKDFIVAEDQLVQVGLGQGLMDYETIISLIKKEQPNAYLIFESIVGEDIQSSYQFISSLLAKKE